MSFNGGSITITGSGLSASSYITVNGLRGEISSHSSSQAVYNVPPQVATNTLSSFSHKDIARLDSSKLTQISDTTSSSNVSASFDGLTNTYYGSSNSPCYLGLDAGSAQKIEVSRVRLFPNIEWSNVGKKILEATI